MAAHVLFLLGIAAQWFLGKRLGLRRRWNVTLLLTIASLYLLNAGQTYFDYYPGPLKTRMEAPLLLWYALITATGLLLFLRDRIPGFQSDRRQFLRDASTAACIAPAAITGFGILRRDQFEIKETDVKIPNLHPDLHGLRLLQISDIHLGPFLSESTLVRMIDACNGLRADVGFMTGDLISTEGDPVDACIQQIARLKATSGIWGCLGNHEEFSNCTDYVTQEAGRRGIRFLRSESQSLAFGSQKINLVGVDYQSKRHPYLTSTKHLLEPNQLNLLLSHNPDVFPVAQKQGFDLTLSGHTHGGQINVEILHQNMNVARFFTPYTKGLYTEQSSSLYVTAGLGTIGMPIRLGSPPEITLIRLCAS